ncbi:retrovirus-related pol polyprotein from transposon TNT 1-94 [Tanacetum coccineum]
MPNKPIKVSIRTKPIAVSQPHVITKKDVNSHSNGLSSTGIDNTAKTRMPQPRSNTKNDRVPYASKSSCSKNKEVELEVHPRNLLLSKNKKHMSSKCNNIKLAIRNDKSEVVCTMCHSNLFMVHRLGMLKAHDKISEASHKLIWKFLGTVHFRNDHIAIILGYGDLQWENILIIKFISLRAWGITCSRLSRNRTTNHYTINLHEMASASPISLMARVTSTKSWLWHQRLSHLNFDTINDLARNDLVTSLPKFKYHKEHLCPSLNDYSRYTWVHFLRSKDEALEVTKNFLKKIAVLLEASVIMAKVIATACYTQNHSIIHRRFGKTPYELINSRKLDISFLHVIGALFYPKNDHENIGKLGTKGLDLTYAPSIITTQQPTKCELDSMFEAMYDDYIGGHPPAAPRTVPASQAP